MEAELLDTRVTKRGRPKGRAPETRRLVEAAYTFLEEEHPAGVRSVTYALFIQKLIASMKDDAKVCRIIGNAREDGLIPWEWITDGTRPLMGMESWDNPAKFVAEQLAAARKDFWQHQPRHIEVWIEKKGRVGTVWPVLEKYGVDYIATGGWNSKTAVYEAAQRILESPVPYTILYLGDYDPSGMRMSEEDLPRRLSRYGAVGNEIKRIALTAADTRQLGRNLAFPATDKGPAFAKKGHRTSRGDPNYPWFVEHYGDQCWELDAMRPTMLRRKLERAIQARIDWPAWERCARVQDAERESLQHYLDRWQRPTL